jgi:flagellar M-ring protein FliF
MSNPVSSFWFRASRGTRLVLGGVAVLVVGVVSYGLFLMLHTPYRVLFSDLAESDAAAITEQLKEQKVPYRLTQNGAAITVPAEQVHDIRLGLMSSDLPLRGGVGFEIFDQQGLGTTEHSQKVSYQRALQGELARTISTLEDVKSVRVHLVMPESSLFTRDRQLASAAVTLTMKPGTALRREQIVGVQRLVAASVPGLEPARVVINDQRGVTLSAGDSGGEGSQAADARLQVKRDIEEYITHKIVTLLDRAYGAGQAIVSVDAALNFDATKTTIQDLIPGGGANAVSGEGRVVRRRQVTAPSTSEQTWTTTAFDGAAPQRQPGSSMEIEYEYGKRIDEVIAAPGAVTRLSVGVVVPGAVEEDKRQRIVDLVRMAAGLNDERGDAVSVQALRELGSSTSIEVEAAGVEGQGDAAANAAGSGSPGMNPLGLQGSRLWIAIAVIAIVALALLAFLGAVGRRRAPLSSEDRQKILEEIQAALNEDPRMTGGRARP